MLIVGSTALKVAGVPVGTPNDLDLIGTLDNVTAYYHKRKADTSQKDTSQFVYINDGKKVLMRFRRPPHIVEAELAWEDNTAWDLLRIVKYDPSLARVRYNYGLPLSDEGIPVASPDLCLTLKLSHRFLRNSPHFLKTMSDIRNLRELGYKMPESVKDWFKAREAETYYYAHPSLKRSKADFFNENEQVPYVYDHDDIHRAVAVRWRPAYEFFKADDKEVMIDKAKWDAVEHDQEFKLNSVLEESYVLALERCLIPFGFKHAPRQAFLKALEKVCTSITSGWWREYAWENYDKVIGLYSPEYVNKFKKTLVEGKIRPYKGGQG